jgi:hypothetical protein
MVNINMWLFLKLHLNLKRLAHSAIELRFGRQFDLSSFQHCTDKCEDNGCVETKKCHTILLINEYWSY